MHQQRQWGGGLHLQERQRKQGAMRLLIQWRGRDLSWQTRRTICLPRWNTGERPHPLSQTLGFELVLLPELYQNTIHLSTTIIRESVPTAIYVKAHRFGSLVALLLFLLLVNYRLPHISTTRKVMFSSLGTFWPLFYDWARWRKVAASIIPWKSTHSIICHISCRMLESNFLILTHYCSLRYFLHAFHFCGLYFNISSFTSLKGVMQSSEKCSKVVHEHLWCSNGIGMRMSRSNNVYGTCAWDVEWRYSESRRCAEQQWEWEEEGEEGNQILISVGRIYYHSNCQCQCVFIVSVIETCRALSARTQDCTVATVKWNNGDYAQSDGECQGAVQCNQTRDTHILLRQALSLELSI